MPLRGILLTSVLVLAAFLVWRQWFQTYHFIEVDPGKLYRDGNRSVREFNTALRRAKPRTVVAIVDEKEYHEPEFARARQIVQARGLEYHWIPVMAGAYPTAEQVKQFLEIATNPAKQPVFYHDDEGIRRAGMLMAAYQESVLGYDNDKAKAAIRAYGHSDRTIDDVKAFIDAYDPVAGLTVDLNLTRPSPARPAPPAAAGAASAVAPADAR